MRYRNIELEFYSHQVFRILKCRSDRETMKKYIENKETKI